MARVPRKKKVVEDKRQAILDAALSLFADQGFHGTAIPEIARKAGVAAGTMYRYFESKEQLVNVLYQGWRDRVQEYVLDGFEFDATPRAQFGAYWRRLFRFALEHPKAIAFLDFHHHAPYLDAASFEKEKRGRATLKPFITAAQEAGVLKDVQPEIIMAITIGALIGLLKASREGNIALTEASITAAEEVCWSGVASVSARKSKG